MFLCGGGNDQAAGLMLKLVVADTATAVAARHELFGFAGHDSLALSSGPIFGSIASSSPADDSSSEGIKYTRHV